MRVKAVRDFGRSRWALWRRMLRLGIYRMPQFSSDRSQLARSQRAKLISWSRWRDLVICEVKTQNE